MINPVSVTLKDKNNIILGILAMHEGEKEEDLTLLNIPNSKHLEWYYIPSKENCLSSYDLEDILKDIKGPWPSMEVGLEETRSIVNWSKVTFPPIHSGFLD